MKGYLADEIHYYLRESITKKVTSPKGTEEIEVYPAYPIPSSRNNTRAAINWASHEKGFGYTPIVIKSPNIPLSNNRISSLSVMGYGGRAVSTIINIDGKNLLVDIKEDIFHQEILINGIKPGGFLIGDFVWIVNAGGHMSLVRCESELWNLAKKNTELRKKDKIKISDLKFGHAYSTISGNSFVYLGNAKNPFSDGKQNVILFCTEEESEYFTSKDILGDLKNSINILENYDPTGTFKVHENTYSGKVTGIKVRSLPNLINEFPCIDISSAFSDSNIEEFSQNGIENWMIKLIEKQYIEYKTQKELLYLHYPLEKRPVKMPSWSKSY